MRKVLQVQQARKETAAKTEQTVLAGRKARKVLQVQQAQEGLREKTGHAVLQAQTARQAPDALRVSRARFKVGIVDPFLINPERVELNTPLLYGDMDALIPTRCIFKRFDVRGRSCLPADVSTVPLIDCTIGTAFTFPKKLLFLARDLRYEYNYTRSEMATAALGTPSPFGNTCGALPTMPGVTRTDIRETSVVITTVGHPTRCLMYDASFSFSLQLTASALARDLTPPAAPTSWPITPECSTICYGFSEECDVTCSPLRAPASWSAKLTCVAWEKKTTGTQTGIVLASQSVHILDMELRDTGAVSRNLFREVPIALTGVYSFFRNTSSVEQTDVIHAGCSIVMFDALDRLRVPTAAPANITVSSFSLNVALSSEEIPCQSLY